MIKRRDRKTKLTEEFRELPEWLAEGVAAFALAKEGRPPPPRVLEGVIASEKTS